MSIPRSDSRAAAGVDDVELVRRWRTGDEVAFTRITQRYHARLLRFARLFVSPGGAAEEAVRDSWLSALALLPSLDGRKAFETWIFGILARRALDGLRLPLQEEPAIERGRFTPAGAWSTPPGRWHEDVSTTKGLQREVLGVVETAVAGLPVAQRAVLTLRDVEGFSAADVCNVLKIAETSQRTLLHRARSSVRAAIEGTSR